MDSTLPTLLATDHEMFVGDLIDQMRKHRQEKSRSYRDLPYFQHLGSEEIFEALDRVRQANLLQIQLKMQKDCSYLQHMDDLSLEGRNAESVRKRVQEGKLQGGFRQLQTGGYTTVCGCLDCQLRLGNKQFNSSFQYEQSKEALSQRVQRSKLTFLGAAWHGKPALALHLAHQGERSDSVGSALHIAVLRGDVELVKLLCCRNECDLSALWGGVSAFDIAVLKGFDDCGEVLLQHGAPLHHFRYESLLEACERGSTLLLRAILHQQGLSGFITDARGNTPLHLACTIADREAVVRILVAHNADCSRENADGMTPLDCCVHACNRNAWRALRHATGGLAKCRRYEAEQRSLRAAVVSNCLFLVRQVHLRADEDKKEKISKAELGDALHLAVSTPGVSDELVQYLVDQGADVNMVKDGMSVLDACLLHNRISETVLGRHARLNRYQDYTLLTAIEQGLIGLTRYLVTTSTKGSKESIVNHRESGRLPLHVASTKGCVDMVKVLLKGTVDVHEQTNDGRTALDLACMELAKLAESEGIRPQGRYLGLCQTVEALLSRGVRLKDWQDETQLDRAKESVHRVAENLRREAQLQKEREEAPLELRRQQKKKREEVDDVVRQAERDIKAAMAEEDKRADAYKECEKLAKKLAESREVLHASSRGGSSDRLPEYLSSKYYQIRIDVLRRKLQEKDQQIEEALKKMDFAEEDYLWLLRKKMRDLRLKHHPDKITDRQPDEEDYKFYERITKAYDVLSAREERDKYLEMSNHITWLQQHGDEEEAKIVEKAIYEMDTQKKVKKPDKREVEESAQPPREYVERAKKKLQERRDEDTSWDRTGDRIKALTLGTPNKCKAPVVTSQRFSDRLEQCWIDIEWVCKCAANCSERVEYELRVQAIDKSAEDWVEVYHGWESSVAGLGPFHVGTYEFMVRARNSVGWGDWSDVAVVALDDPKWEKQQRREAEQQASREQAKVVQHELQELLDELQEMQGTSKLTIHRACKLLFCLQAELRRSRSVRQHFAKPAILREAETAIKALEKWRDRKEAFAEWKQSLLEMRNALLHEGPLVDRPEGVDLEQFVSQDQSYFCSLSPPIRNLIVQTLLGLDVKQVFKKLTTPQREAIVSTLRAAAELGKAVVVHVPGAEEKDAKDASSKEKSRTIFTKHQVDQLLRVAERFSAARTLGLQTLVASQTLAASQTVVTSETPAAKIVRESSEAGAALEREQEEEPIGRPTPSSCSSSTPAQVGLKTTTKSRVPDTASSSASISDEKLTEKRTRTVHVVGLPHRGDVTRADLVMALSPFAEVDGARVGGVDALVRFTTPEEAKAALKALEQGAVSLRRVLLSGTLAPTDSLTEEALLRASGKPLPEKMDKRPPAATVAVAQDTPPPPQREQPPPPQPKQQPQPKPPLQLLLRPRIPMEQLVTADSSTVMFKCPLCNGVAWEPKVTMCCQKIFCASCLDAFLQTSVACVHCSKTLVDGQGGTGGSGEQRVKSLDRTSSTGQAVLWRVYCNLRIKCVQKDCGWTGPILDINNHLAACPSASDPPTAASPSSLEQPTRAAQVHQVKAPDDLCGTTCSVVHDHKATDSSQLTVKVGDTVHIDQQAAHGWVYGRLVNSLGSNEGWFPSFCLPEKQPPKPQAAPPPMHPPEPHTKVNKDYIASDPAQLSVTVGELVKVRQRDQSGWTFVVRVSSQGIGPREGWVPDWLLAHDTAD